jgi:hypothetical protein
MGDIRPGENQRAAIDPTVLVSKEIEENTIFEKKVPLDKIFFDVYGREIKLPHANDIKGKWNENAVGCLLLSYRDDIDQYACLDGGHRIYVARELGYTHLPARIYIDLTQKQEAELYTIFGKVVTQTPIDKFRARLVMGDKTAIGIVEILSRYGLQVPLTTGHHGSGLVRCVRVMDRIYNQHGAGALDWIMGTTFKIWGTDPSAYSTWAIKGMEAFWMRYAHTQKLRYKLLLNKLAKYGLKALQHRYNTIRLSMTTTASLRNAWGRAMWEIYNHRLPEASRLPEWSDSFMTPQGRAKVSEASRKSNTDKAKARQGKGYRPRKKAH